MSKKTYQPVDIVKSCPVHGPMVDSFKISDRKWCSECLFDLFIREYVHEIQMWSIRDGQRVDE